MIRVYCDVCGREIKNNKTYNLIIKKKHKEDKDYEYRKEDICSKCKDRMISNLLSEYPPALVE